jgi:hypothetical protein
LIAEAEGKQPPQRVLLVHRPCGSWPADWFPQKAGPLDQLSPLLESFSKVKKKMLVMKGVDTGADHSKHGDKHATGIITMLCGGMPVQPPGTSQDDLNDTESKTITAPGPSIEQYLLQHEPMKSLLTAGVPSIQLAGTSRSAQASGFACLRVMSYAAAMRGMFGESRSKVAFNNTLGRIATDAAADAAALAKAQAQGKSVLDFVMKDLARMKTQVPSSQAAKLEAHVQAIRELEARLNASPTTVCEPPTLLTQPRTGGISGAQPDEIEHESLCKNMLSIIKGSFQCDITRVASLTFAHGNNDLRPKMYVPKSSFSNSGDHHGVSHAGSGDDAVKAKRDTDKFYGDMLGQMLAEMDQIPEGDPALGETLLDHTLVIYFSECSVGDDHSPKNMPIALFGGKFLKMNTNQYLQFGSSVYINDVWTSLLNAWGLNIEQFGDPKWCKGSGPNAAKGIFG